MTNRNRVRLSKLALGLSIALAAAPAFAQNTTSALDGRVSAASGAPVAGAQVTIVHAESGSAATVTTDADGRYAARGLRPGGPYTITVTKDGMTEKRENVYLQLAETAHFDAKLGTADSAQLNTVVVQGSGDSVFSPSAMGAGTGISREDLESFASVRRDLQDYARQDPRVTLATGRFGELQLSVAGQHSRYNSITIDGVTTSDTFGLESNGLPTAKQPVSIDAIDTVQVNVSNYDVTQTGYIGGNINAVTKSGTNEFHGSVGYTLRNENMSGDVYNPVSDVYSEPLDFKETNKTITFGGPLIKDRLFFFAAYEELTSTRAGFLYGPMGSELTNIGITQADLDAVIAIAARPCGPGIAPTCGFDAGSFEPTDGTLKVTDKLIKLDWNINDDHRASLRYNKTNQDEDVFRSFGTDSLSLSTHWDADIKVFENWTGHLFSDWSADFSTELKLSHRTVDSTHEINLDIPAVSIRFTGTDPSGQGKSTRFLRFGPESSRHFNELHTQTFDGFLAGTWFRGDHELKFGADLQRSDFYNSFQLNTRGSYNFDCLYTTQCTNSFEAGRPASYTATVPQTGRVLDDSAAIWGMENLGLFLQDTWTVNDNLSVLFGLRADRVSVGDEPLFQERASDGLSTSDAVILDNTGPYKRQSGGFGFDNTVTIDGSQLFQPRVGFNYTFDSDRPMQLRGGAGLFQGASANVWLSNPFTNTGEAVQATGCGGTLGSCGVFFDSDANNPPVLVTSPPQLVVDIIDPELDQPSVWKGNLGFEKEIFLDKLVFSADIIVTRVKEAIYYQNLNLGQSSLVSPVDGRPMFWNASGYNPACFKADGTFNTAVCTGGTAVTSRARSNSAYRDVIIARPTDKGGAEALTLSLSRDSGNFGWSAAYTRTNSNEVSALTSSTSGSQWGKMPAFDPNHPELARSSYEIKDRFAGTFNWHHAFFGDYKTRVGIFYEGRSGKPYSWVYANDMNGDASSRGNDLVYIPTAPGSGEVIFLGGAAEEARFWEIVNANDSLKDFKGQVVDRNSGTSPWVNQFDLRISQELPGFMEGHKARIGLDIMNVGNLVNKSWGQIYEAFDIEATRKFVNYVGMQGDKYVYSLPASGAERLELRNFRGESAWAAQLSFKYEF